MQDVPEGQAATYPVVVQIIDQTGVTATKMLHKMKEKVRIVIEAAAQAANYKLRITRESPGSRRVGGLSVWETTFSVMYTSF